MIPQLTRPITARNLRRISRRGLARGKFTRRKFLGGAGALAASTAFAGSPIFNGPGLGSAAGGGGGGGGGSGSLLAFVDGLPAKQAAGMSYFIWGQHSYYYQTPNNVPGAMSVFSGGTTPATAYYQGTSAHYQPGIMCFGLQGPFNGDVNNTQQHGSAGNDTASLANSFCGAGGIPLLSMWPINPASSSSTNGEGDFSVNPWPDILTPGTATYISWQANCAALGDICNNINGQFLLRPFVELNLGGSFWYAPGNSFGVTNSQFQQLYILTRASILARITNPLTKIVWVYNINSGVGNYVGPFPGTAYVDVLGYDIYYDFPGTGMVSDGVYADFTAIGLPIMICEGANGPAGGGPDGGSYPAALQDMKTNTPQCFAYCTWVDGDQPPGNNTAAQITSFMTDPVMINLPALPPFS